MPTPVKFKIGPFAHLNTTTTPIDSGSLIVANDRGNLYYDTSSTRNVVGAEVVVTSSATQGVIVAATNTSGVIEGMRIACCIAHQPTGDVSLKLGDSSSTAYNIYSRGATQLTGAQCQIGDVLDLTFRNNVTIGSSSYTGWWFTGAAADSSRTITVSEGQITAS